MLCNSGQIVNWQHSYNNSQDSLSIKAQHCDGDKTMPVAAAIVSKFTGTLPVSASEETRNRQQHTNGQHIESLDWPGISVLIDAYHQYEGGKSHSSHCLHSWIYWMRNVMKLRHASLIKI